VRYIRAAEGSARVTNDRVMAAVGWGRLIFLAALMTAGGVRVWAELGGGDVLLVVNQDSPTSVYIADMYRQYHDGIADNQVVYLSDLPDSSGPGSTALHEIISRSDFESKIANPIRQHLVNHNLVNSTKAIITTAGMPYRIEDTAYPNVVWPGGGYALPPHYPGPCYVDAASVESELSMLFQIDPDSPHPVYLQNRVVNPYQGYRGSSIDSFDRDIINNLNNIQQWNYIKQSSTDPNPVLMEGQRNGLYGTKNRQFSAGDIYLTCRLDGPKQQGQSAVFAVRDMLERAKRASDGNCGIEPGQATAVFDYTPGKNDLVRDRIFNLQRDADYNVYQPDTPQPPDVSGIEKRNDYEHGYEQMTGQEPADDVLNTAPMPAGHDLTVVSDHRIYHRTNQADLGEGQAVVGLACFGVADDEGSSADYLTHGGPDNGALFKTAYGAVFTSIESVNAATLFTDKTTVQGKIVDFLSIGGSAAIGHSFEPLSDATIDNEFLFYNLLADEDGDGLADMTFIEAAFTALPYLSWSEVVIGDPLMRLAYGPGGTAHAERLPGDANLDGYVSRYDIWLIADKVGEIFGQDGYDDRMDINQDGVIGRYDVWLATNNLGACYDAGGSGSVPEPGSMILLLVGGMLAFCDRRKLNKKIAG